MLVKLNVPGSDTELRTASGSAAANLGQVNLA